MAQQTAMMQLLAQLKDERQKLPMHIEWDRCYQAIEMVIENNYLPMEKEQIEKAFSDGQETPINHPTIPHYSKDEYFNDNYNK